MANLAPIFLPKASRRDLAQGTWKTFPDELLIFRDSRVEPRPKIAGFDLDGTLIRTASGNVFPRDNDDWQLWSSEVVGEIQRLQDDGFKICIFTNQKGIHMKKVSINGFKIKIQKICVKLGVPIQVFISLGTPNYRKPYVGMWELLERAENDGVPIDRALSLYVGDAAGRLRTPTRTRPDHSLADRLFAANLGVPFRTPEQFFLKRMEDEPFKLPSFCSATLLKDANAKNRLFEPASARFPMADVEVVVLVGPPASGKSTLAARLSTWHDYAIVNQDELKTAAACSQRVAQLLANRRRVIVDNTNRDPETRRRYVELAREAGVPCRCVLMDCSVDQAIHNNLYRKITGMADEKHKYVNDMVVRMFYNEFKMPTLEEGFTDLVHANFLPDFNGDEERRRIFAMYLIEK